MSEIIYYVLMSCFKMNQFWSEMYKLVPEKKRKKTRDLVKDAG